VIEARPVEAVCWDVGGVFSGRPVDAVAAVAADAGVDPEVVFAAVFGPYHLDGDHPWHRLERGEVPLVEAWTAIEASLLEVGVDLPLAEFFGRFGDDPHDRAVVRETLLELRGRGLRMAVVTNNVREFSEVDGGGWRRLVPLEAVDVVVDSSAVGMRKPDPAIYRHTLESLGVAPGAAVFVDDMPANVDAAVALGMRGVLVEDPAVAMAELLALVGR
jgi:epoxide hydrolase-like predicted phosphatase